MSGYLKAAKAQENKEVYEEAGRQKNLLEVANLKGLIILFIYLFICIGYN